MKKSFLSPMISLLVSLTIALGILIGNLGDYGLLTSAHAQGGRTCEGGGGGATVVSDSVDVEAGLILSGINVRNVTVNGTFLEQATIIGHVQLIDVRVGGPTGLTQVNGVLIGSGGRPCTGGVLIGSGGDNGEGNGVLIGSGGAGPAVNGVLIGSDGRPVISGMIGEASGTAVGGTLTGDDVSVASGFITGQNLLLSGATIDQGSISGSITTIRIPLAN